jgi:glycosyltransferase involved in cell wall biosynthesis
LKETGIRQLPPEIYEDMKGRDFVITGLQSWDIPIGSNAIDLAWEFARNNRVLYVNTPLDHMTLVRREHKPETARRLSVLQRKDSPLRQISDTLWVLDLPFTVWSVNGLPDGPLFDFFNRRNNRRIFAYVRKIARKLGFSDIIHFIDNDIYRSRYARQYLKPKFSVYYRRDNLQAYEFWARHAVRLEPELIAESDLVVCNSAWYAAYSATLNQASYDIGQGVDLSSYQTQTESAVPDLLRNIPEPRIGYIGDITSIRLDPDLLYEVAAARPDCSFVMIGGEDPVFRAHALHHLGNVHFPGSIPKSSVPLYMQALQVCLNPQVLNEITQGNYPRKVDEYLAMGKPVVATRTATMELFRDHVYLCSGAGEYLESIDKALKDNETGRVLERIRFARSHSWENNAALIMNHIEKHINS